MPEPRTTEQPQPETFGLKAQRLAYFQSSYFPGDPMLLPSLLGWVTLIFSFVAVPALFKWMMADTFRWPIILLLFIPGMLLGLALNHFIPEVRERSKKSQPDYGVYLRYVEACHESSRVAAERAHVQRERDLEAQRLLRQQVSWWKTLDGRRFELEIANHLRSIGLTVLMRGGSGDGGVDLEVALSGKRVLIQCKAYQEFISPGAVRDLYGTLLHEKADEAWLIATSGFYAGATAFARGKPIRLVTVSDLLTGRWSPKG